MAHAAESQHWYTRTGEPAYTVKARDGSDRPATLRDARKLGLVPSVTHIIKCAAAPALERWKMDQMLHAALTLPRGSEEPEADWISRVWTDSGETARKAAERGTAIHAAIQGHFGLEEPSDAVFMAHIQGAVASIEQWCNCEYDQLLYDSEQSFASQLGFGGKVDLQVSGIKGVKLSGVIDFKTKEFDASAELKTWDEQAMQLAAYRHGLGMENARCAICYVSVTQPGLAKLIEIPEDELQRGWECFVYLLGFWKAKNRYPCGWQEQKAA